MLVIAIVPLLAAIAGVLLYALASNVVLKEVGRGLFWCGTLVTLLVLAHKTVSIGGG